MKEGQTKKRAILYEEYFDLLGDGNEAIVLAQMMYRQSRVKDFESFIEEENERRKNNDEEEIDTSKGWIYKSSDKLSEEIMLFSGRTALRCVTNLVKKGYIERRKNPKYKRDKTYQYRVNIYKLAKDLLNLGYTIPNRDKYIDYKSIGQDETLIGQNGESIEQNGEAIPETTIETITKKKYIKKKTDLKDISVDEIINIWNDIKESQKDKKWRQTRKATPKIKDLRSKTQREYTKEELTIAIENYIKEIRGRNKNSGYAEHRFTLYEFLDNNKGLQKFVNF